jgi:putative transposase
VKGFKTPVPPANRDFSQRELSFDTPRPQLGRSLGELILRLARENPHWGYKRIVGELKAVGVSVSATSVRRVLLAAGLPPAPERGHSSWRTFLRQEAASMLACDFLTVETAFLQRIYILFFISLATRRIEYVACTTNPDGRWIAQQARNLLMQLAMSSRSGFSSMIATRSSATPSMRCSEASASR